MIYLIESGSNDGLTDELNRAFDKALGQLLRGNGPSEGDGKDKKDQDREDEEGKLKCDCISGLRRMLV